MLRILAFLLMFTGAWPPTQAAAQQPPLLRYPVLRPAGPRIAITSFRGDAYSQEFMGTFNRALWRAISEWNSYTLVSPGLYPRRFPQEPKDFEQPEATRERRLPQGLNILDWSVPPTRAKFLVFGHSHEWNSALAVYAWVFDATQATVGGAQLLAKQYFGEFNERSVEQLAYSLAADVVGVGNVRPPIPGK